MLVSCVTHIDVYLEVCSRGRLLGYVVECPGSDHRETCGCNVVKSGIHVCVGKHVDPVGVGTVEYIRTTKYRVVWLEERVSWSSTGLPAIKLKLPIIDRNKA